MKITIHQSLCGEQHKGWDLLRTTMSDLNVAKTLSFKTDLQEQTGSIAWVPAVRGFAEGNYFLIMKTFEDTSVGVRKGRKFSHVLILDAHDIADVDDLSPILHLLPASINKEAAIQPITIELMREQEEPVYTRSFSGRFRKLIHGSLHLQDYKNTIVWVGQDDFEPALVGYWKTLTAQERLLLNFGISFHHDGGRSGLSNFFTVPANVQSKFLNSGYFIVGTNDVHTPSDIIEQVVLGDKKARRRVDEFASTIQAHPFTKDDLRFVAKTLDTFENLERSTDFKKINTLANVVGQFAPTEKQGAIFKKKLIDRIKRLALTIPYGDLSVLRPFKLEAFTDSKAILSGLLSQWMSKHLFHSGRRPAYAQAFFDQAALTGKNWWDETAREQLKEYLASITPAKAAIIYSWAVQPAKVFKKIGGLIDPSKDAEAAFLKQLPQNPSKELLEELSALSLPNVWFRLYAKVLGSQHDLERALEALIEIDTDTDSFDAIDILLKGREVSQVIQSAVKLGDSRLVERAGELVYKNPKLLQGIVLSNDQWQLIWLHALRKGLSMGAGWKEGEQLVWSFLDLVVSGQSVNGDLLDIISQNPHGNILEYGNRLLLWDKLQGKTKENFLKTSSSALLERLSKNSNTEIPDDMELIRYAGDTGVWDFLYYNSNNIKSVIPIFEKFSQLSDSHLVDYLKRFGGTISAVVATQLGKMVESRGFEGSAYEIYSRASKHNNWRFSLAECHHLLNTWEKTKLSFSGMLSSARITPDLWWQSAEELIVELYPNLTSLTTVWRKSGGKESDLPMTGTPNSAWHEALQHLRARKFQGITIDSLLDEIRKQYNNNEKFKAIDGLRKELLKSNQP